MDPFEYVIILTLLILGLGIAQVLIGVSNLITNKSIKWSLPHSMMTLLIFFLQIQEWWVTYSYSMDVREWTIRMIIVWLVYPILLFIAARVLFPYKEIQNEPVDLEQYYWKSWPALFTIFIIIALTSLIQNILFSDIPIKDQILQIAVIVSYLIFIVGKIKKRILHIAFLSVQLLGWLIYFATEDYTIGG